MVTPATENERESRPRRRVTVGARVKDEGWAECAAEHRLGAEAHFLHAEP